MKLIAHLSFLLLTLLATLSLDAQYVSPNNANGTRKTVEERKYEESRNNQNRITYKPDPVKQERTSEYVPARSGVRSITTEAVAKKEIPAPDYQIETLFNGTSALRAVSRGTGYFDKKWGAIDKAGRLVIPIEYSYRLYFKEGYAAVRLGSKYGYIDETGTYLIKPQMDYASEFAEGMAGVTVNNKCGFVNTAGNMVIPL